MAKRLSVLKSGRKQRNVIMEPGWLAHINRELRVPMQGWGSTGGLGALSVGVDPCTQPRQAGSWFHMESTGISKGSALLGHSATLCNVPPSIHTHAWMGLIPGLASSAHGAARSALSCSLLLLSQAVVTQQSPTAVPLLFPLLPPTHPLASLLPPGLSRSIQAEGCDVTPSLLIDIAPSVSHCSPWMLIFSSRYFPQANFSVTFHPFSAVSGCYFLPSRCFLFQT